MELWASKIYVKICIAGQHRDMLDQVLESFSIKADYDLNIMQQSRFASKKIVLEIKKFLRL